MCGIAGWVAYDRDLTQCHDILAAMTETVAPRGPDAGGTYITPRAALGHRRLAVIDIEGGAQPMTVSRDGATVAALTYSGEVYNFQELRAELVSHGHAFRTRSDTEVVLHAYLQWGAAFVERLNGMFALALWDTRSEELLLVRDRMGVKPLYYYPTGAGVMFGSEAKAILAHPDVAPVVDADGLRELLGFAKTPGVALFRGMAEVRPGHYVRVRREGVTEHRYWALEAREHTDDLDRTVATVRELLDDIVRRQLIADVPLCSLLSGGLDSSVVTALAARGLAEAGAGPVRSFAVDFVGQTENFRPEPMRATPDAPFAHLLAKHVGADHTDVVLDSAALMDPGNRAAALRGMDMPTAVSDIYTSLYLLFRAVRAESTVALSGESADEVFGGYPWFHDPEVVATPMFPWLASLHRLAAITGPASRIRQHLFAPELTDRLDVPTYLRDRYSQALAEVPHLPAADPHERRMREICYLNLTRFVTLLLDRKDRMSMASGLEVRVPFCDHRLVQYVFNTPWSMKSFDGREKSLLRAATRDVLPTEIVERVKSPYPSTQDPGYAVALRDRLRELAADESAPAHALLDQKELAATLASDEDPGLSRVAAEMALGLNDWLRDYEISLQL